MEQNTVARSSRFREAYGRLKRWQKVTMAMACVVVFVTTYLLILPAISMTAETKVLDCRADIHQHTEECYDSDKELKCGYADFVVHEHADNCYDEDGKLVCELPEIKEHKHTDKCYKEEKVLVCELEESEEHQHSDECYETEKILICNNEAVLHEHKDSCYDEDGKLICDKLEVKEHKHGDGCFDVVETEETDKEKSEAAEKKVEQRSADEEVSVEKEEPDKTEEAEKISEPVCEVEIEKGSKTAEDSAPARKKGSFMMAPLLLGAGETTEPLRVEDYYNDKAEPPVIYMEYKLKDTTTWIDVSTLSGDECIPGDAGLRLNMGYSGVPVKALSKAGRQMTYQIPDIMRDPKTGGKIMLGADQVGTIEVDGNIATLTFDEEWLDPQGEDSTISGTFWITSDINVTKAEEDYPKTLVLGDVSIYLDFGENVIEQYGSVEISKSEPAVTKEGDEWYYTYTLTVVAGPDGCPAAKVEDAFAENPYTGAYEIVSASKGNCTTTGGKLTWTIGDMDPNEGETLVYKVKIADGYLGGEVPKESILNTANVYSKTYLRDTETVDFLPTATVSTSKAYYTSSGNGVFKFAVSITAGSDNDYTFEHVTFKDDMSSSSAAVKAHARYDTAKELKITRTNADGTKTVLPLSWDDVTFGEGGNSFTLKTDKAIQLAPSEVLKFDYNIIVDDGVYPALGEENGKVNNYFGPILDNDGNTELTKSYSASITHKEWARKTGGEFQKDPQTFYISDGAEVYDDTAGYNPETGKTEQYIRPMTSPGQYEVPEGSYLYECVANEAGDWDISSASLKDSMDKAYMEYKGFIRMDAYLMDSGIPKVSDSDEDVIENLKNRHVEKTVWIKVDGERGFDFTPEQVGMDGTYAYLLTYYARPETTDTLVNVTVDNTFGVSGDVGKGTGEKITLAAVEEKKSVTIQSAESYSAEKEAWYFENKAKTASLGNFNYGALYWAIKADGRLKAGMKIKDNANTSVYSYFKENSLVGVYTGNLGEEGIAGYKNLGELLEGGLLTPVNNPASDPVYTLQYFNASESTEYAPSKLTGEAKLAPVAIITLNKDISLNEGDSLYIIYRTSPSDTNAPAKGKSKSYPNQLKYKGPDDVWSAMQEVSLSAYNEMDICKYAYIGTYDGNESTGQLADTINSYHPNISTDVAKAAIVDGGDMKHGTYVDWFFKLGASKAMEGRYRVIDDVPDGLQPEFLYMYNWTTDYTVNAVQIPEAELPEGNWTEHITIMKGRSNTSSSASTQKTLYWYSDGNRVLFDLTEFKANKNERGVQLILGTRIVDNDVNFNRVEKTFNNTVELYDDRGVFDEKSSASISYSKNTIEKNGAWEESMANVYPFVITANPLGEDLLRTSEYITIKDTMSDNMVFMPETVKVKDTATDTDISDSCSVAVDGQTFSIAVPDNVPIEIKYSARITAAMGEKTDLWNKAYWEGYESGGAMAEHEDFSFDAGGTADADTPVTLKITKNDKNHAERTLTGAGFTIKEMELSEGALIIKDGGLSTSDNTNENGVVTFGLDPSPQLLPNVVYQITETTVPAGYIADPEPHYFMIKKKDKTTKEYPEIVGQIEALAEPHIVIQDYATSPQYKINIYDQPIEYTMPATGGIGTKIFYILGTLLVIGAAVLLIARRRLD